MGLQWVTVLSIHASDRSCCLGLRADTRARVMNGSSHSLVSYTRSIKRPIQTVYEARSLRLVE